MNKYMMSLLFIFSCNSLLPMTKEQENFLKRQYKKLKSDFDLIRKCYGTTSPACTDNERKEAQKAVWRIGGAVAGVVGAIIVVSGLGTLWYMRLQQEVDDEKSGAEAKLEIQQEIEAFKKLALDKAQITITAIKQEGGVITVDIDESMTVPQLMKKEATFAQVFKEAYPDIKMVIIRTKNRNVSYPINF